MRTTRLFPLFLTIVFICTVLVACSSGASETERNAPTASELISGDPQNVPIPGMVTMVDIGAESCVPCKMMTPILLELSKEYDGRAAIAFIDVWENRDEAQKYAIRSIPTQIFYDANGKEQYRHVGFLSKEDIVRKLTELGVK